MFLVRTSWGKVLKDFLFAVFHILGMVIIEIKNLIVGVQNKNKKCFLFFMVLGIGSRPWYMLGKHSATELTSLVQKVDLNIDYCGICQVQKLQ